LSGVQVAWIRFNGDLKFAVQRIVIAGCRAAVVGGYAVVPGTDGVLLADLAAVAIDVLIIDIQFNADSHEESLREHLGDKSMRGHRHAR
jgi:hypothetical protein